MTITTYGPGDEQTWGFCHNHPNDPRTEVDEDEAVEVADENELDCRRQEREDLDDWLDSCEKDRRAEEHFATRDVGRDAEDAAQEDES